MAEETTGGDTQKVEQLQAELEKAKDELKAANKESAARRFELKELKEKNEDGLSESQKLTKEMAELKTLLAKNEAEKKAATIKAAVLAKAAELGFEYPGDALALLDLSKVEITDDKVTGFEKGLDDLAKANRLPMKGETPHRKGTLTFNRQTKIGGSDEHKPVIPPALTHI